MAKDPSEVLDAALLENATTPQSVTTPGGSATSQSITDVIALDKYLAGKRAARRGRSGIRIQQIQGGSP